MVSELLDWEDGQKGADGDQEGNQDTAGEERRMEGDGEAQCERKA